jgi:hypothetical protein
MKPIPIELEREVGTLLSDLRSAGWKITFYHYDAGSFGDWFIDLCRGAHAIRLVKDRSQYMISGSQEEEIKAAGLWKAFDDFGEFSQSVCGFALSTK